ncbi:MAG TPA: hypothetical protein VLG69_00725 [Candidatus Andersenbacteria bacterium]|nr:hypothetical protein [Candidatus Andersenbacteria bacterium]
MESWLRQCRQLLADTFAPARCIDCCGEGTWYCAQCRKNAPIAFQTCIGCKTSHPRGKTCISCREDIPLTGIISAGAYTNHALQRGIEWLKFKGVRPVAEILAGIMIPHLQLIVPFDELSRSALLIPIPLHARKLQQRGFNQCQDIAEGISRICNIEIAPLLIRKKATHSQATLRHDARPENVKDAFALACSEEEYKNLVTKKPIIILLDDVTTTGSTLIAAALALPNIPDVSIWCATVARG